jgi:hypothetical protein
MYRRGVDVIYTTMDMQNIGKPNNIKVFESNKTKGSKSAMVTYARGRKHIAIKKNKYRKVITLQITVHMYSIRSFINLRLFIYPKRPKLNIFYLYMKRGFNERNILLFGFV